MPCPDRPSAVVLDEVPWLSEQDDLFDDALQTAWDRLLSRRPAMGARRPGQALDRDLGPVAPRHEPVAPKAFMPAVGRDRATAPLPVYREMRAAYPRSSMKRKRRAAPPDVPRDVPRWLLPRPAGDIARDSGRGPGGPAARRRGSRRLVHGRVLPLRRPQGRRPRWASGPPRRRLCRVIDQEVAALLDLQHGLVSLAQLRALGVTRAQRRWQLNRGWRYVLPPMWANPRLEAPGGVRLPIPDGWFDDVALAIQVHSRRYHSSMTAWDATVTRDGIFAEHGIPVLAVTPSAIRDAPTETVRRIERAHVQAAARPRPAVLARLGAIT